MMTSFRESLERRRTVALENRQEPKSRWYVYLMILIAALLLLALAVREMSAVSALRFDDEGALARVLAQGGTIADYTSSGAVEALAEAQLALHKTPWLIAGILTLLLGTLIAFMGIRSKSLAWGLSSVPVLGAGVASLIGYAQACAASAAVSSLAGYENLPRVTDILSVSSEAQLALARADLYLARWGLLALGTLLLLIALFGFIRDVGTIRGAVSSRSMKSVPHTLFVVALVVLLYASILITFMGAFYTLGTSSNANGLGTALNDYGRSALSTVEQTISDADAGVVKAEGKLADAQKELEQAQKQLEAAKTEEEQKKANKAVKNANKDIEKQTKKITEAKQAREEALANYEDARANVKTYAPYSISDLIRLIELQLPYTEVYGTRIDQMCEAIAREHAAEWNLTEEEMYVLVSKVTSYGITASDLSTIKIRWIILIAGVVLLTAVLLVSGWRRVTGLMFRHWFLSLFALISVFPFYWIVVSATNTSMDVTLGKLWFGDNLLVNLINASFTGSLSRSFLNSLRNALLVTVGSLIISSAAGYGFVVYRDRAKELVMKLLMLSMMIPTAATLVPLFKLFGGNGLGILNTTWAIVLPSLSTAFLIFMFRQGAQSFPKDLIEAARIDGMGEFGIFARIFFPVMRPTYAAAATVTFMNAWNAYLWPLVALNTDESQTMPVYIANILEGYVIDFGAVMLAVTISTLPTVIIFFFLQKSFVEGIIGSVKQ